MSNIGKTRINKVAIGNYGEQIAAKFLEEKGYVILNTKYRCRYGEVDIVAKLGNVMAFVEVKYRSNLKFGYPCEAVNLKKQKKIITTTEYYIMENSIFDFDIRFDVIEIININETEIRHIEGAFIK